jgi:hypothetical protein
MPFIAAAIGGGLGLLGSSMSSSSARKAANTSANAQREAARIAAEESRFRPVAITTGFGRSAFETDPEGRVTGASYELTPELQALRDRIMSSTGTGADFAARGLGAAEGLFDLGSRYMAKTPEEAAQEWMATQQAALAPGREQAMSGLMNRLSQTGTQGLGVAQAGGGMANPLAQAFANAQAQQDRELAALAQEQGRARTTFGTGLLSDAFKLATGGYSPVNTMLTTASGIEELGRGALDIGSALGGRLANPTGANALMTAGTSAARGLESVNRFNPLASTLMGAASNPALTGALGNWLGGLNVGPGGVPTGSMGGIGPYGGNATGGFLTGGW